MTKKEMDKSARDRGQCFCLLLHECNARKGEMEARDFLRRLYRDHRLSPIELGARLRALEELRVGKVHALLVKAANSRRERDGVALVGMRSRTRLGAISRP